MAVKKGRISNKLTNEECVCLYQAYKNGESAYDIAKYFDLHPCSISVLIHRIEREAVKRGYKVESIVRPKNGRFDHKHRRKVNSDIYDDRYIQTEDDFESDDVMLYG